jgi:predicted neutral ceramidase superfamily lipid hydrolase
MIKQHEELTLISGILAITAFSFLVYNTHVTKSTSHLTFLWLFLLLVAQVLMFTYGKINHIQGLYVPASLYILGLMYILYIKVIYKETNKIEAELKNKNIIK